MDENEGLCNICLEKYNAVKKVPKQMSCCKAVICLECLKDIYQGRKQATCPMCRFNEMINPDELPTKQSELKQFITCPQCKSMASKSNLFYSFDNHNICCIECQENDLSLIEYIQIILDDVESITQKSSCVNNVILIQKLNVKLKSKLDAFFEDIKKRIFINLREKIIQEIKEQFTYNLKNKVTPLQNEVDKLRNSIINLQLFAKESKNNLISAQTLLSEINTYGKYKDKISLCSSNYDCIQSFIQENAVFELKKDIKKDELVSFFMNAFETVLSDHVQLGNKTEINFFNKHNNNILNNNKNYGCIISVAPDLGNKSKNQHEKKIPIFRNTLTNTNKLLHKFTPSNKNQQSFESDNSS